jgi:hypothetical protein
MTGFVNGILKPTMLWNMTPCKFVRQLTAIVNPKAEFSRLLCAKLHGVIWQLTAVLPWSVATDLASRIIMELRQLLDPLSNCQRTVGVTSRVIDPAVSNVQSQPQH